MVFEPRLQLYSLSGHIHVRKVSLSQETVDFLAALLYFVEGSVKNGTLLGEFEV